MSHILSQRTWCWILATACSLPFAGLAMVLGTPQEVLVLDLQGSPALEMKMNMYIEVGPLGFSGTCNGAGELRSMMEKKAAVTCILAGDVEGQHVDLTLDTLVIEDMLYLRIRSANTRGIPYDQTFNAVVGKWMSMPMSATSLNAAPAKPNPFDLESVNANFHLEHAGFPGGHSYRLRLRDEASKFSMNNTIAQIVAQTGQPEIIDSATARMQTDMKIDTDVAHRIQFLRMFMQWEMTMRPAGSPESLPFRFSLQMEAHPSRTSVTIRAPQNAIPIVSAVMNTQTGLQIEPDLSGRGGIPISASIDDLPARAIYPVGVGLYLVVTPTHVIMFDAETNEIIRSGKR